MTSDLVRTEDAVLKGTVDGSAGVPGVVAMLTDRERNIY